MRKTVLITGGAGFIGAHVANELLANGYSVRAYDSLVPQVHGPQRRRPAYLAAEADLIVADIRDAAALTRALQDVDMVVHLVSLVGVGQSMYQIGSTPASIISARRRCLQASRGSPWSG